MSGRLRLKWTGIHSYEVLFRDTAHGFLAWAFAMIVGAAALGSVATYLAGSGAVASGANNAATDYFVAQLMRPSAAKPTTTASNVAVSSRQARSILVHGASQGATLSTTDRAYLAQLVAAQTGASQADAEKRVSDVLAQSKAEADRGRKAAASISIWLTISMFVGAFAASLAAIEGGQLRDRRWRGVLWTRAYTEAQIEP